MATIHELQNTIDVETPLGYGKAIAWIDYGSQMNTVWKVVFYKDGSVRNFYDDDIRVYPNKMDGGEIEKGFPTNQQLIKGMKNHFGPKSEKEQNKRVVDSIQDWEQALIKELLSDPFNAQGFYQDNHDKPQYKLGNSYYVLNHDLTKIIYMYTKLTY